MKEKTKKSCGYCGKKFKTKRSLITHLKEEFESIIMDEDLVVGQLENLGVENYG